MNAIKTNTLAERLVDRMVIESVRSGKPMQRGNSAVIPENDKAGIYYKGMKIAEVRGKKVRVHPHGFDKAVTRRTINALLMSLVPKGARKQAPYIAKRDSNFVVGHAMKGDPKTRIEEVVPSDKPTVVDLGTDIPAEENNGDVQSA